MGKKIIVTKPTYEGLTDTNVDHQIFNSDYDTLKYYLAGYVDVTVNGANVETNITHGLGYIPFFTAFVNFFADPLGDDFHMVPGVFTDIGIYTLANAYADSSKLYFRIETNSAVGDYRFYYKIFRNSLGL